ncbi:MAG TPA: creatininase family protein [Solirubrobacteraceae bacterium]|nr:creatininase family protein [Solirubrobacteraceae bacterium]
MGAVELDGLSWPEVKAEIEAGRDTVVMALGAFEQHGPALPLETDVLLGDHLAWAIADRLDAFVAPTVRIGCSRHHLGFPGTLSLSDETFAGVVGDVVSSLAGGGFRRVVLLPSHGGNFAPLAAAIKKIGDTVDGLRVTALTDPAPLFSPAQVGADEFGVPLREGGIHSGEWETSMIMAIRPELVHLERAEAGYTGDPDEAFRRIFNDGTASLSKIGVVGDPRRASAEHGKRYWEAVIEATLEAIGER